MTDHHHIEEREWDPLYFIHSYEAGCARREILLVDMPGHGHTLVDVLAGSAQDNHVVADSLRNLVEAGDVADAHLAASIELGRTAVLSAEPPTAEQLRFLRELAERLGEEFVPPRSKAAATKAMRLSSPSRWVRNGDDCVTLEVAA